VRAPRNPESRTVTQHLVAAVAADTTSSDHLAPVGVGFLVFAVFLYCLLMRDPDERVPTSTALTHLAVSVMAGAAVTMALIYLGLR
jgi:hypothetical protein